MQAFVDTHYAQEKASVLIPSTTAGVNHTIANACMIPTVWAPSFLLGGTPKETLDKVELLVAASPTEHLPSLELGNHIFDPECANFRLQSELKYLSLNVPTLGFSWKSPTKWWQTSKCHFNVFNGIYSDHMNPSVIILFDFLELDTLYQNQFSKFTYNPFCNSLKDIFIFCDHQVRSKE
jgi:hypothetical protein